MALLPEPDTLFRQEACKDSSCKSLVLIAAVNMGLRMAHAHGQHWLLMLTTEQHGTIFVLRWIKSGGIFTLMQLDSFTGPTGLTLCVAQKVAFLEHEHERDCPAGALSP